MAKGCQQWVDGNRGFVERGRDHRKRIGSDLEKPGPETQCREHRETYPPRAQGVFSRTKILSSNWTEGERMYGVYPGPHKREGFFLFVFKYSVFKIYSRKQHQETWGCMLIEQKILEVIQFNQLILGE